MKIQHQFLQTVLAVFLLLPFAADTQAQQQSQQPGVPTLSPALHSALYPEVMCVHCIVPQGDRGYIVHREFDKDPSMVTMYDRNGKKVLEARLEPRDFAKVSLRAAGAAQTGVILAVGGGTMTDGSIQGFIAKTDLAGRTVQSVRTGRYSPHQVCEATDGTVWTLGYDLDYHDSTDVDKNVLRHYSLEKGLLESLVDRDSIPPDETFDRLWGADGDELVVHRYGDGWGISWAKVSTPPATPD